MKTLLGSAPKACNCLPQGKGYLVEHWPDVQETRSTWETCAKLRPEGEAFFVYLGGLHIAPLSSKGTPPPGGEGWGEGVFMLQWPYTLGSVKM